MEQHSFLLDLGIALGIALLGGSLARAVRLPAVIGYLLAGIVVGPHTPGIFASPATVKPVAEFGIVLLMFAVGAHFSLDALREVQRLALLGGGLQIVGTTILGLLVGLGLGWGFYGGLFLGCALSLSSTAVMLKILEERGELETPHGRIMLGLLVVQDFSLVVMLALLPELSRFSTEGGRALASLVLALLKAGLFIGLTLLAARRIVPALLHRVAQIQSPELFLLGAVSLCLFTALAAQWAGLGLEIGAFMAGIMVSETDYAHKIADQINPLRDLFAALFFVSVGMLLQPAFVARHALAVSVVVAAILFGKSLITALSVYALHREGRTALLAGLGLAQVGEFSFVLAQVGIAKGLLPSEIANVIFSAAFITLLLCPFLYRLADPFYQRLRRGPPAGERSTLD